MASLSECNLYKNNQSDPYHIGNVYGGLPTNLLTNFIGWFVLIIMFIFIRKSAFSYMRINRLGQLVKKNQKTIIKKWTQVFFGSSDTSDKMETSSECSEEDTDQRDQWNKANEIDDNDMSDNKGFVKKQDSDTETNETIATDIETVSESEVNQSEQEDSGIQSPGILSNRRTSDSPKKNRQKMARQSSMCKEDEGFWSWFTKTFTMNDAKMKLLAGPDAVQYLRFQRYVIIFVFITTLFSIGIILPINFQGTLQGNATDFGHTTLINLTAESPFLWVHISLAFLLFPIAIYLMRRFSVELKFQDSNLEITRTIAIERIPRHMCKEDNLRRHFSEAYPDMEIHDIKFAYNVAKLTELSLELRNASDAKKYGERYKRKNEKELKLYPHIAARCCCCFCMPFSKKESVIEYYTDEKERLEAEVEAQSEISINSPLGLAFVTFVSINDAREVYEDHTSSIFSWRHHPPTSSMSVTLQPEKWRMWFAPPPRDIYWENLSDQRRWLITKSVLINILLFIVAFFLTTPELLVTQAEGIILTLLGPDAGTQWKIPSAITDFLPTLMLWSFTALLPVLVAYTDRWMGHWTRSEENHNIMKKTFWYLLFMAVILPTFGFTSGQAYFQFLFMENQNETYRWDCIFLPDSGAFFVNYVITAAMVGSGLELIRFPELAWYLLQVCLSKSEADTPAIQREVTYEFRFGEQYARMLLIFAMVVMYSISCPLITPFGCLYFVLKYFSDRHNLAFVYAPSKINRKVHASAINFVIFSVGLLQFFMVVFSILRSGNISDPSPRTKYAVVLFIITINIFSAQIWSYTCKKISPIKYVDVLFLEDTEDDEHNEEYLPDVLKGWVPRRRRKLATISTKRVKYESKENDNYGTFHKFNTVKLDYKDKENTADSLDQFNSISETVAETLTP